MSGIAYPALFHKENDSFWVEFPDLEGCFSSGETLEDARENAKEALELYLDQSDGAYPETNRKPSSIDDIKADKDAIVMIVEC